MNQKIKKEYQRWVELAKDHDVAMELTEIAGDEGRIEDAFYRNRKGAGAAGWTFPNVSLSKSGDPGSDGAWNRICQEM